MRYGFPDPRRRQLDQSAKQISGAPGAGSSRALDVLQAFPVLDAGSIVRPPRELPKASTPAAQSEHQADLRSPGAGSSPAWMHSSLLGASPSAARSGAPGRSPKPRSRQLAGPGCAEAFLNPRRQLLDQSTRRISPKSREKADRPPGRAAGLPESSLPEARSEHQEPSEAQERAPRRP